MTDDSSFYISVLVGMRFDLEKQPMTVEYRSGIEEYEKKLLEFSLPELQAEYQRAELVKLRFGKPEYTLSESDLVEKGHFEEQLSKLSPSELVHYVSTSEDQTVQNLVEAHRFRALTPELRASYFGEPPKYVHWGALDCWTIDEATSLTMGLDPQGDSFPRIKRVCESLAASGSSSRAEQARHALKVKREELWNEISVKGFPTDPLLQSDEDPEEVLREWTFADAAGEYKELEDRIKRAIDAGNLREKISPAMYIVWARKSGISVPEELERTVEVRNELPDWKARYDKLLREYQAVSNERDDLRREVDQLRAKRDTVSLTERPSLLRMIIGMAIGGYGYDPKAARSPVTKQIWTDLGNHGVPLNEDTVRKWLGIAAEEELPSDRK